MNLTKPGLIHIEVSRKSAETVGKLVCQRAKRLSVSGTRIDGLHEAGDKLLKASRRTLSAKNIKIWTLTKTEAKSLFHWSVWCRHWPETQDQFTKKEQSAFDEVLRGLVDSFSKSRGMSIDDAKYMIDLFGQRDAAPARLLEQIPDAGFVHRLKKRVSRIDRILSTEINRLPPFIQSLTFKKYP